MTKIKFEDLRVEDQVKAISTILVTLNLEGVGGNKEIFTK
jgi:hypothetical protein